MWLECHTDPNQSVWVLLLKELIVPLFLNDIGVGAAAIKKVKAKPMGSPIYLLLLLSCLAIGSVSLVVFAGAIVFIVGAWKRERRNASGE